MKSRPEVSQAFFSATKKGLDYVFQATANNLDLEGVADLELSDLNPKLHLVYPNL